MYSFDQTEEQYIKNGKEKNKYEKENNSGIAVCGAAGDVIG